MTSLSDFEIAGLIISHAHRLNEFLAVGENKANLQPVIARIKELVEMLSEHSEDKDVSDHRRPFN